MTLPDKAAVATPNTVRVEIIRRLEDLEATRRDWEALALTANSFSAAQTIDYAIAGWQVTPKAAETELAVILLWRGEKLVCVWPLYTRKIGGITVATHMGSGSNEEYAGPLIFQDEDAEKTASLALDEARKISDALEVYAMDPTSPMGRLLDGIGGFKYRNLLRSPTISLRDHADFAAWFSTKSKSFRQGLRYDRKRLSQLGQLEFASTVGSLDGQELVTWLFANKRAWLTERGIGESWIRDPQGEGFFSALLSRKAPRTPSVGEVLGFALKLDGQIIAGCICLRSDKLLEFFITGFDARHGAFSPGNLMIEDCVRWACERRLDFDFRLNTDPYKLRWIDRFDDRLTVILASGLRGARRPIQFGARRAVRRTRQQLKTTALRLMKRFGASR